MLTVHGAKGLLCPPTVRAFTSWHDVHSCPLELSRTRKFCESLSIACTCGEWQLIQSTLFASSFTAGSPVVWVAASDANRSGASTNGNFKLNGCEPCRLVPNMSALFM